MLLLILWNSFENSTYSNEIWMEFDFSYRQFDRIEFLNIFQTKNMK